MVTTSLLLRKLKLKIETLYKQKLTVPGENDMCCGGGLVHD
jgi:hypothetical protein